LAFLLLFPTQIFLFFLGPIGSYFFRVTIMLRTMLVSITCFLNGLRPLFVAKRPKQILLVYVVKKRRDNLQCMSVVKSQKNDAFTVCFCCEALDLFSARKETKSLPVILVANGY
jgi:hypothetical protein